MNLLFDLDGTLTDPREGIIACFEHALRGLGRPIPPASMLERLIGPPLRDAFATLSLDGDLIEAAVALYRERFTMAGMFENNVYAGIPEALAALSAEGARLLVATSKPRVYAEAILEHFGLRKHFDAVHGSELDGRLSDKRELIGHVLSASRLAAGETTMVGDRRHDVVGALGNAVLPVGVLWGYGSEAELTAAGARRLIGAPADLVQLVF